MDNPPDTLLPTKNLEDQLYITFGEKGYGHSALKEY
jgi:hypothetical protein